MENFIKNNYKGNKLTSYDNFKERQYQYRVDEILDDINTNNVDFSIIQEESKRLYEEIKKMLDERGKKYLLEYNDVEVHKRTYEEYALAEQIYKDLER